MSALKYWVWLSECRGVSNQTRLALLRHFGSPEDADMNGAWEDSITLEHVGSLNAAFWVKAMSSKDEKPSNDTSVSLQAEGLVAADEGA